MKKKRENVNILGGHWLEREKEPRMDCLEGSRGNWQVLAGKVWKWHLNNLVVPSES